MILIYAIYKKTTDSYINLLNLTLRKRINSEIDSNNK